MDDKQKKQQPSPMPGKTDQGKDRDKKPQSDNVGNEDKNEDKEDKIEEEDTDDSDEAVTQRNPRIQDDPRDEVD